MDGTITRPDQALDFLGLAVAELPLGFLVVDSSGAVAYANQAARELLDWSVDATGPWPEALQQVLQEFDNSQNHLSWTGLSFVSNPHRWCEAWLSRPRPTTNTENLILITLRSPEEERQRSFAWRASMRQLALIGEISAALNTTLGLSETFNVILVGVTAHEGLGFNRAFLFLGDQTGEWLEGCTAIGPAGPAQAGRIWDALSGKSTGGLTEAVYSYQMALDGEDAEVNRRVQATKLPCKGTDNPFAAILGGAPAGIISCDDRLPPEIKAAFATLDAQTLACAPLRSRDRVVGLLLADNRITGKPITNEMLQALELLAGYAGLAVERAGLADKLQKRIGQLHQARERIEGIQQIMARLERYSVIGEITAEVAHQIRNPLTIIGGFAKNLLTDKSADDPEYRPLSIICKHAERVCEMLEHLVSVEQGDEQPGQPFNLESIIRQAWEVNEIHAASRRIEWRWTSELGQTEMVGRPGALRFAFFEILAGLSRHLQPGAVVALHAQQSDGGGRVVISLPTTDKNKDQAREAINRIFKGEWGSGRAQRNLALENLQEHHGALGIANTPDGFPALIIEFEPVVESADENNINRR